MDKKSPVSTQTQATSAKQAKSNKNIAPSNQLGVVFKYANVFAPVSNYFPTNQQLDDLAEFMVSRVDARDSTIPSGYTYLSQFIAHDISFDSKSRTDPSGHIDPPTVSNLRNPFFDLESVYGFDVPANHNEPRRSRLLKPGSQTLLNLGNTFGESKVTASFPNDLAREANSPQAVIVDPRNDENLPVAQTLVAFIKFHNAIVTHLNEPDTIATFEKAQRLAIRHYQHIVLTDFLPRVVKQGVLNDVLNNGNKFYFPAQIQNALPFEFSFAAFRFGHSMSRSSYQWNRIFNDQSDTRARLHELADATGMGHRLERTNNRLASAWLINWKRFYDINGSQAAEGNNFNFASSINTTVAPQLGYLPPPALGYHRLKSLPALDLFRNRALGFPSGQELVNEMKKKIQIELLDQAAIENLLPVGLKSVFSATTPLWFYLLAEAEIEALQGNPGKLGEAGSRIVAETIIGILKESPHSILTNPFGTGEFLGTNGIFGMPELLNFVASINGSFELNPVG